ASCAVAREVGKPRTFMPSATRRPTPSVKYRVVEPLPRPMSIPSRTSSRAFSATARLNNPWSATHVPLSFDAARRAPLEAEYGVARDQHARARLHHQGSGLGVDASVDLDLEVGGQVPNAADFVGAVRDERLAAEARLDGHHVDHVDVGRDLAQGVDRRR